MGSEVNPKNTLTKKKPTTKQQTKHPFQPKRLVHVTHQSILAYYVSLLPPYIKTFSNRYLFPIKKLHFWVKSLNYFSFKMLKMLYSHLHTCKAIYS